MFLYLLFNFDIPYIPTICFSAAKPSFKQPRTANKVLQEELDWSVSRPSSRANGQSLNISDKQAFIKSLTANEYDFYLKYRSLAPRGLYSLNQNPRVRGMKSKLNQETKQIMYVFVFVSLTQYIVSVMYVICSREIE